MDVPLSGTQQSGEDQYVGITIPCNKRCKRVRAECWESTEKGVTNCLTQSGKAAQRRRCLSRSLQHEEFTKQEKVRDTTLSWFPSCLSAPSSGPASVGDSQDSILGELPSYLQSLSDLIQSQGF